MYVASIHHATCAFEIAIEDSRPPLCCGDDCTALYTVNRGRRYRTSARMLASIGDESVYLIPARWMYAFCTWNARPVYSMYIHTYCTLRAIGRRCLVSEASHARTNATAVWSSDEEVRWGTVGHVVRGWFVLHERTLRTRCWLPRGCEFDRQRRQHGS